jgi:sigma-B regulation protein RsbU (phosphoserine phosphatase)
MVVALEAAHQAEVQTEIVRHELSRAREIQERLLPEHLAAWPGLLELAVRFRAAREMSGDFYDVFELTQSTSTDDPTAERAPLQIAVGDVAGKSIPAALVMALARTTLRAVVQQIMDVRARRTAVAEGPPRQRGDVVMAPVEPLAIPSPAVTMRLTGGVLHRDVGRRDFVACALALVEPPEADEPGPRLRLVNAGQVPPILCRDGGAEELEPPGDRLPLGVLPDPQYEDLLVTLRPGDVIVFASDGLPEAPLSSRETAPGATHYAPPEAPGEMFGFERLAGSAAYWATHAADAEEVAAGVWADVNDWSGDASDHDDMTLVVLRVLGG